jgi:phosphoglycerate dehydrogenase-like enzyme
MSQLRVFCDMQMGESALDLLREGVAPHELLLPSEPAASVLVSSAADPALVVVEIAFGQPAAASALASPRLRWLHLSTAGFTRYDTPEFRAAAVARGLVVTNSSEVYAEACAEHAFAFLLAQTRRLPEALQSRVANGSPEWWAARDGCSILRGQRVVILGYGAIAARLVAMLGPFRMEVSAFRRQARGDEAVPVVALDALPAALAAADHVVNILPDNADSRGFIDAARLGQMKPGAAFYNIGRGTTVDQNALAAALRSGRLAAAWLDVTEPEPLPLGHPMLALPNCFITPHLAGGHHNESETLVRHFLANFQRHLAGSPLHDRIM